MVTEYNKVYVLRNPENNKVCLTYWGSSPKHKVTLMYILGIR